MNQIMIAGDWHGNESHMKYCFQIAKDFACTHIFQLGDFGYWEEQYINSVCREADRTGIYLFWLEGNHEDFGLMRRNGLYPDMDATSYTILFNSGKIPVHYMPRGYELLVGNTSFLAVGGGYSIDKSERTEGISWFPEETISQETTDKLCKKQSKIDILLAHDCPSGIYIPKTRVTAESMTNRKRLTRIVEARKPDRIYCGHYHTQMRIEARFYEHTAKLTILNRDGTGSDSWTIIETGEGT